MPSEFPTPFDWEATPEAVAALLPARTKGEWGKGGEWSTDTTPTLEQVEEICAMATWRVANKLRVTEERDICESGPNELAEEDANLRAAMRVELTYFQNQLRTDQSPYEKLKKEEEEVWKDLFDQYKDQCGGADGGGGTGPGGEEMPRGSFPKSSGIGTRFF